MPWTAQNKGCAGNEVWSFGNTTQPTLEKYLRARQSLSGYLGELAANVSARGVPTMRPLFFEFPNDENCIGIDDQFLLGPDLLVSPVYRRAATRRRMYFPAGETWSSFWEPAETVVGGVWKEVAAPLETIPVFFRGRHPASRGQPGSEL